MKYHFHNKIDLNIVYIINKYKISHIYTMQKQMKYSCPYCLLKKNSKDTFEKHIGLCKFIHTSAKEHKINIDSKEKIPSQEIMLQYILDLSEKYEKLEQKVIKLQNTAFQIKKKTFDEYISSLHPCEETYDQWLKKIVISDNDLENLFKNDLKVCIKSILYTIFENTDFTKLPLRAFSQKVNTIYIYDTKWRAMTNDELEQLVLILSHRIVKKYTQWSEEHRIEILNDSTMYERSMCYLHKANGSYNFSSRVTDIKKIIISKIQINLKNIDL